MLLRFARFFARRPLTLLALAISAVAGGAALLGFAILSPDEHRAQTTLEDPADNPRKILGRGWFDSWPEKRTDNLRLFYFGGGGIGIYDEGSSYRYSIDVFELERQNDKLSIKFLQDKKTAETRFTITRCDEKPPFDLCLDLADSPRGPKRYYGFDDDDEDSAGKMPWGAERIRRAEALAR